MNMLYVLWMFLNNDMGLVVNYETNKINIYIYNMDVDFGMNGYKPTESFGQVERISMPE